MKSKKFRLEVPETEHRERLDRFLAAELPRQGVETSRRRIRRLIKRGAVYVDRRRVRIASRSLRSGGVVEVFWRETEEAPNLVSPFRAEWILFEDEELIAVNKPAGLPTQAGAEDAENHLLAHLTCYLRNRDGGREPYLALHHRLDRGTSGIVLLAKHRRVNTALARAFRERQVNKLYHAICRGETPPLSAFFSVRNHLVSERGRSGKRRTIASPSRGRFAASDFRFLELLAVNRGNREEWLAWIEARPRTGRTHQLRVHLADAGWPVLGDRLYGKRRTRGRMHLHARRLELEHPIRRKPLVIESPVPKDWRLAQAFAAPDPT